MDTQWLFSRLADEIDNWKQEHVRVPAQSQDKLTPEELYERRMAELQAEMVARTAW